MAFREVPVFEVREVRLWLRGETLRGIERLASVDRKTVRRYVEAATAQGVVRDGGEDQLHDQLIASVVEAVRPHRSDGHGPAGVGCRRNACRYFVAGWSPGPLRSGTPGSGRCGVCAGGGEEGGEGMGLSPTVRPRRITVLAASAA